MTEDTSRQVEAPVHVPKNSDLPIESSYIPKSFWLGGLKITVERDDALIDAKKVIGEAHYSSQKIVLDASVAPLQLLEQSFTHEMVHWILYVMNEDELRNNEKFVDVFAHFLYQAMATREKQTC